MWRVKVFCAGLGRTGTASLKAALDELGYAPCYHLPEVIADRRRIAQWQRAADGKAVDWDEIFAGYQAAVYWPAAAFWRDIVDHYPDAKVILTVREPEGWYDSARATIFRSALIASTPPGRSLLWLSTLTRPRLRRLRRMMRAAVWDRIFDGRLADRRHAIAAFERHARAVRAYVPAERLLVYRVADGWPPLCAFLGVPVPDVPFPAGNDTATFRRSQVRQIAGGLAVPVAVGAVAAVLIAAARRGRLPLLRSSRRGPLAGRWRRPAGGRARLVAGHRPHP